MAADDRELSRLESHEVAALTRYDLIKRARQAIEVRRHQFQKNATRYLLDPSDAAYLKSAMAAEYSAAHPHCYAHVWEFDTAIMKGKYLVTCDGYRLHCIKATDKQLGSYIIWENTIYIMHPGDVGRLPDYAGFMKYTDLTFMSKARLDASRNLDDQVFFIGEKKNVPMITVSAGYDKLVKASGSDEGHSLPHTLQYAYLQDARTDQDCTMLFGYDDKEPVYVIDRKLRIAVISPINIRRGRSIGRNDWIQDSMEREERLGRIAAAFFDWRTHGFSNDAIREFVMSLEFGNLDWSHRPGMNREMRFQAKGAINEMFTDIKYRRWEPPSLEVETAVTEDDHLDGMWDLTKQMRRAAIEEAA